MARHLLVTNDFPPKVGGIQSYLYELWRRLEPGRAVILTASSHPDAESFDRDHGVTIERVSSRTLFLPTIGALRAIRAAIRRHQPDLVLFDPAWPLGLLGRFLPVPYGVVVHGAEVTIPGHLPLVASSLRSVLTHASVVVSAGNYPESQTRRVAAEHHPPTVQAPPGVDLGRFHPLDEAARTRARTLAGVSSDELLVTSYSRLVPRKGFDTLIRASAELRESFPNLRVQIGGTGRDQRRLMALARRSGAPVEFVGRVDDERLNEWIGASDLFVMACRSRWFGLEAEGFGIVFVEAAAAGRAVVAGRSGGSGDALRDEQTGLLVEHPARAGELGRAMGRLLGDAALRDEMSERARGFVREMYDWERIARTFSRHLAPFDHFEIDESDAVA